MCKKNFIFIDVKNKQFFRSNVDDAVPSFRVFHDYRLKCGDIDAQSFNNDRQDLNDSGYTEIKNPQFIHLDLYYMKDSGKFYSAGVLELNRGDAEANPAGHWYNTMSCIQEMVWNGKLPDLVAGARFETFVTGEGHPGGYPHLFRLREVQ